MLRFTRSFAVGLAASWWQGADAISPPGSRCEKPYWQRHGVVLIQSNWSVEGTLDSSRVLANHAPGVDVDSLLMVVDRWEPPKAVTECLTWPIAFERRRWSHEHPETALPSSTRDALDHGALRAWATMVRNFDPDFDAADFVLETGRPLQRLAGWDKGEEDLEALLNSELVLRSPGGRWALDLSIGTAVGPSGEVWYDVDRGYVVYDARSGEQLDFWVSTLTWFEAATWLDEKTFVIADTDEVSGSCGCAPIRAPVLTIGDLEERWISRYWGAPILPTVIRQLRHEGAALRDRTFPILSSPPPKKTPR